MKYLIDEKTLTGLANAIRKINGESKTYSPVEMIEAVTNIMDSAVYILVDENGIEIPAVYVDTETKLTATTNDIRVGMTAVNGDGIITGEKEIPSYHTTEGLQIIPVGGSCDIQMPADKCEYTKLQALICMWNSSLSNSVCTEKVVIEGKVYAVKSTEEIASVNVDMINNRIVLGIANTSSVPYLVRYISYKEIK
jgi:hypothetical protein